MLAFAPMIRTTRPTTAQEPLARSAHRGAPPCWPAPRTPPPLNVLWLYLTWSSQLSHDVLVDSHTILTTCNGNMNTPCSVHNMNQQHIATRHTHTPLIGQTPKSGLFLTLVSPHVAMHQLGVCYGRAGCLTKSNTNIIWKIEFQNFNFGTSSKTTGSEKIHSTNKFLLFNHKTYSTRHCLFYIPMHWPWTKYLAFMGSHLWYSSSHFEPSK